MNVSDAPPPISPFLLRTSVESGSAVLLAGRCRETGRLVFPLPAGEGWQVVELPREGELWSFTVQRFRPKSPPYCGPEAFEAYAVGYVDLGPLIVEGRLTGAPLDAFRIGMRMQVVPLVLELVAPERRVTTYAFAPAGVTS